jgi:hypothetical protein
MPGVVYFIAAATTHAIVLKTLIYIPNSLSLPDLAAIEHCRITHRRHPGARKRGEHKQENFMGTNCIPAQAGRH